MTPRCRPTCPYLLALLVLLVASQAVRAQDSVSNISDGSSYPVFLLEVGNKVFYAAADSSEGFGLYQYDTSAEMGGRIASPGFVEPPVLLTPLGDLIFFMAESLEDGEGRELWVSNGWTANQLIVNPGSGDAGSTESAAVVGDYFVFEGYEDGGSDLELWASDGTEAGTQMIKDIHPTDAPLISEFTAAGDYVYFRADDGTHGSELWKTNGTAAGTVMVADLNPGSDGSVPQSMVAFGNEIVFTAYEPIDGSELFISDGTTITQLGDLDPGSGSSYPFGLTVVDDWVYFSADIPSTGNELWRTNGVLADYVGDIHPGTEDSDPRLFTSLNGEVFFFADDGTHGPELWKTDGTGAGTVLVEDIVPGLEGDPFVSWIETHEDHVYFSIDAGDGAGRELWRSGGDAASTEIVQDLYPGEENGAVGAGISVNGHLYLAARDGTDIGSELYRTDSTLGNMELTWDPTPDRGSNPEQLGFWIDQQGDEHVLAFARSPLLGRELVAIDATAIPDPRPVEISDDWTGRDGAPEDAEYVVDGAELYFSVDSEFTGYEPAIATTEFSVTFQEIFDGPLGSFPTDFFLLGGSGYCFAIRAFVPQPVFGLFRLDRIDGPELIHEFGLNRPSGPVAIVDGFAIFAASDPATGVELWRTNGTTAERLMDIYPGTIGSEPEGFTKLGAEVYFSALHPDHGRELWLTNGTAGGTRLVADLESGASDSNPRQLVAGAPYLYFTAVETGRGRELYVATSAGAERLDEIVPGPGGGSPQHLTAAGGRVYFSADDGTGSGREPWLADDAGVSQLVDLYPGPSSSNPTEFHEHHGRCYFAAEDGLLGRELWRAEGESFGLATDAIAPGGLSSSPGQFMSHGPFLYFAAESEEYGREIWVWQDFGATDVPTEPTRLADGFDLNVSSPARGTARLRFQLERDGAPEFRLYDVVGRVRASWSPGPLPRGDHDLEWRLDSGSRVPSGVYFVRADLVDRQVTAKLVVSR